MKLSVSLCLSSLIHSPYSCHPNVTHKAFILRSSLFLNSVNPWGILDPPCYFLSVTEGCTCCALMHKYLFSVAGIFSSYWPTKDQTASCRREEKTLSHCVSESVWGTFCVIWCQSFSQIELIFLKMLHLALWLKGLQQFASWGGRTSSFIVRSLFELSRPWCAGY